jgi:hypothetical protein
MNKQLIDAFLTWKLPKSVAADKCATVIYYDFDRFGTNLLNQKEADELISHLLRTLIGTIGEMTPVFDMLQREEISSGKARDYLHAWLCGDLDLALKHDGR